MRIAAVGGARGARPVGDAVSNEKAGSMSGCGCASLSSLPWLPHGTGRNIVGKSSNHFRQQPLLVAVAGARH